MPEDENTKEIVEGIMRVQLSNDYSKMTRKHKISLGPYSQENPAVCVNCGKPEAAWSSITEECGGRVSRSLIFGDSYSPPP